MGKNVQGESFLRRTTAKGQEISSVSETMTTASMSVRSVEDQARDAAFSNIKSPVMRKLSGAAVTVPQTAPTVLEMETAYNDVELKMSSNSIKRKKKAEQAGKRFDQQRELLTKAAPVKQPLADNAAVAAKLKALDISGLMHQDSGKSGYERLLAKYQEIMQELDYIDDYEAYVQGRLDNELPGLQNGDPGIEEIRKEQAKLKTLYDIRAYYDVLQSLLKNKYYSLLPQDEMEKLSYVELRKRLYKLYEDGDPSKADLISYYQDLIRLKMLDLSKEGNAVLREKQYYDELDPAPRVKEDKRKPAEVMKKMGKLYEKLEEYTISAKHLCDAGTIEMYKKKFLETYLDDFNKFSADPRVDLTRPPLNRLNAAFRDYLQPGGAALSTQDTLHQIVLSVKPKFDDEIKRSADTTPGIHLTPEQMSGIHELGAYVLQMGIEKNRIPFVNNLLQAPPDQQLLMFYIMECGLQSISLDASFFTALNNYRPNIEIFRYQASFENLSRAMRKAIKLKPELEAFGRFQTEISQVDQMVEYDRDQNDPRGLHRTFDDKKLSVIQAMAGRGRLLRMLYRNAGLHEDMPVDMISDLSLRKRIIDEYKKIGELCTRLRDIVDAENAANPGNAPADPQPDYDSQSLRSGRAEIPEAEIVPGSFDIAKEGMDYLKDYVVDDAYGTVNNLINAITKGSPGYLNSVTGTISGITGIIGAVGLIMNTISFGKSYDDLTAADAWVQGVWLGGSLIETTGSFLYSAGSITDLVGNTMKSLSGTADLGKEILSHSANLSAAAGAFAIGAGVIKMGVSGAQLVRAGLSDNEVNRSRLELNNTLAQKRINGDPITEDEDRLERFLMHQQREVNIQEASAGVGIVTGAMAAVAGGLMLGTVTAPAGAILGIVTMGVDVITRISCWSARKHNKRVTVDEYLHLDDAVNAVKSRHADQRIRNKKESELKDMVREEMLAMMGFASNDDCFRFICEQMAETLYKKAVLDPNPEQMYSDALNSMSMHVDRSKNKPSYQAIFTKLMSQG
ncbi:MAG: hypothetical protein K6A71_01450 [Lachnospiraceae bacterium]|nr:hypothetical protein [Lachnospiraceae bacterium]